MYTSTRVGAAYTARAEICIPQQELTRCNPPLVMKNVLCATSTDAAYTAGAGAA